MKGTSRWIRYVKVCASMLFVWSVLCMGGCRKDTRFEGEAELHFSSASVTFDTVFTSLSTVTERLIVTNPYPGDVYTDVFLQGGANSCFSVNVDGVPCTSLKNVCIPAKDSIFIFIKANVMPNGQDTPLLVVDTLRFMTNGGRQDVPLFVYGQDAHFIVADSRVGSIPYKIVAAEGEHRVWKNDKPYVIYGFAVVDSVGKLEIEAGTRIYIHKNGGLWVYKGGCLKVRGTEDEPVVFQGDRTEDFYQKDYEQWSRIWINEGTEDNEIDHAVIKNAYIGIQAEILDGSMGNRLLLSNTWIQKSAGIGFLGRGYTVEARNNVFSDCGQYALALVQGGNYTFEHNTVCNFYRLAARKTPSVFFSNYYDVGNVRYVADFKANFVNNVIWGSQKREFSCSKEESARFEASMRYGLLRCDTVYPDVFEAGLLRNKDPMLENCSKDIFEPKEGSPCLGAGFYLQTCPYDKKGIARSNPPTLGAYEQVYKNEE